MQKAQDVGVGQSGYTVRIRNNETGEIRSRFEKLDWDEFTLFWWTEGNFGCDCNRDLEFQRAGGVPEELLGGETCGEKRFTVIDATFADGRVIVIDPPAEHCHVK